MIEYFKYSLDNNFFWSEVNLKGEKKYYVEGYASNIFKDKADEVVDFSAQQDIHMQCNNENITLDVEHEQWYSEDGKVLQRPKNDKIPVAKIVHSELRPDGVWVKAQLNTNLRSFNELWGSIKDGFLKAFSIAFYPTEKVGNVIKHLKLVNITLTGSPVGEGVGFTASMKSAAAWLDSQELKAEFKPKLDNPADSPNMDNPADAYPVKSPKMTEVKSEDNKMKCNKCEKEFDDKEKLAEHMESVHGKEEKKEAPEAKAETEDSKEDKKEDAAETKCATGCHGGLKAEEPVIDIKAMKEAHNAEVATLKAQYEQAIQTHSTEVAKLKAELAKPVMKAVVEQTMPESKPVMQMVSPLGLIN